MTAIHADINANHSIANDSNTMAQKTLLPTGRFAPSPTGELHLGSLTTALASYCHIKSLGGRWLLRIEDTDIQRCDQQFSEQILLDLEALGMLWDGDVVYQSERTDIYNDYLDTILQPLTYSCQCSRKQLAQFWVLQARQQHVADDYSRKDSDRQRYPRYCIKANLDKQQHKLRLQLPDYMTGFVDGIQGLHWANPQQTLGDMVIRRSDGMINYILAASIDDGLQQVTHIMRGLDILPMTTAQIAIMQMVKLPAIEHWYHLPLILNDEGQKLSKQNLAQPIDTRQPSELLATALHWLRQPVVDLDTPERMLAQAVSQWKNKPLQGLQQLNMSDKKP